MNTVSKDICLELRRKLNAETIQTTTQTLVEVISGKDVRNIFPLKTNEKKFKHLKPTPNHTQMPTEDT